MVMLVVAGVAALVMREKLLEFIAMAEGALPVLPLAAAVMGFCLSTCAIAAPSISLEGKYLWILREAPVDESGLLWIKVGFQLLLSLPCTVIGGACISIAVGLPVWQGVVLILVMALFGVGHAAFGMLMGLCFPKLDAVNETVVVKQSLAVMLGMLVPMAALGVCGLLYWLGGMLAPWAALVLPIALLAALTAVCVIILAKRGPAMLRAL